ncbi:HEPN domain-containing protein [Bacillus sp. BPN334]|uniref:HEPN domain-containing protein n=1 Tax=Bacillus sp. BPN334 TaxID=2217815 RepID=UPI0011ECA795|nr:HEPN domain-containing protein [Bacillus sp. BPN334]KAA0788693.1 hypothetical protein DN393_13800 [Bacillus sp. BPN334]
MYLNLIGSLIGFENTKHEQAFGDFNVTNEEKFLNDNFLDDYFVKRIGEIEVDSLMEHAYIYSSLNIDEIPAEYQPVNIPAIISNSIAMLDGWLMALWFVKDNSVSRRNIYIIQKHEKGQAVALRSTTDSNTNALGEQCQTVFSSEELDEALKWMGLIRPHLTGKDRTGEEIEQGFIKDDSHEIYTKDHRFLRALRFIFLARRQSFVPEKITSLISAMETLLSTSNNELKFQVSSRACKIIGGDLEEKKNNYNIIREAYDLRSAYVHGAKLVGRYSRENGKLASLATNMDNVIRNLMKELLEKYPELAEKDNDGLGDWFRDLILE